MSWVTTKNDVKQHFSRKKSDKKFFKQPAQRLQIYLLFAQKNLRPLSVCFEGPTWKTFFHIAQAILLVCYVMAITWVNNRKRKCLLVAFRCSKVCHRQILARPPKHYVIQLSTFTWCQKFHLFQSKCKIQNISFQKKFLRISEFWQEIKWDFFTI